MPDPSARPSPPPPVDREAALRRFVEQVSTLPVRDDRSIDDILGYDSDGLPA